MDVTKHLLRLAAILALLGGWEARARNDVPAWEPATQQKEPGQVSFPISCGPGAQSDFDRTMTLFHSPWYAQSAQRFTGLARKYPNCGMTYWGIALSILHNAPGGPRMSEKACKEGRAAVEKAISMTPRTERVRDYLAAIEGFYDKGAKTDSLRTRQMAYGRAMEQVHLRHPDDMEAAVLFALALNMTASTTGETSGNWRRAAAILEKVFAKQPGHPGSAHYLIRGCSGGDRHPPG